VPRTASAPLLFAAIAAATGCGPCDGVLPVSIRLRFKHLRLQNVGVHAASTLSVTDEISLVS